MIKIVLLRNVSPANYGGIKKHCIELSSLFGSSKKISILPIKDLPYRRIPVINKTCFKLFYLYKYLKQTECDIVHIHGFATFEVLQSFIVAHWLKKRIVYSPHFHPFQYLQHPLLGKIYFNCFLRFFLKYASAIVTITNTDTIFFLRYHKKVYKIPHYYTSSVKALVPIEKRKNMILFVGRNEENKGLFHLKGLSKQYEIHLVTNKGTLDRDDYIVHTNISNEELCLLYRQASLVVIPSRYEAFSYVALEAFAHGTPVVMSNTVMIADYLDGISGFSTFNYGDEDGFLRAVDKTIGVFVDTEKILSIFSVETVEKQYENVYLDVIR